MEELPRALHLGWSQLPSGALQSRAACPGSPQFAQSFTGASRLAELGVPREPVALGKPDLACCWPLPLGAREPVWLMRARARRAVTSSESAEESPPLLTIDLKFVMRVRTSEGVRSSESS